MNTRLLSKAILLIAATLTAMPLLTACSEDDPFDSWDNSGTTQGGSSTTGGGSTTTTDGTTMTYEALAFTVGFDSADQTTYGQTPETAPTDATAADYEDWADNFAVQHTISITYADGTATVDGRVDGVSVAVSGADAAVTSTVAGVNYVLSGSSSEGSFKMVDGDDDKKFMLTLNGLTLTKANGAAINIQPSKRCYLQLADATANTLTSLGSYSGSDEQQKGCIFSEGKLLIGGTGALTVSSATLHGIASDDYVWLHAGPSLTITALAKDGIHANDSVVVSGGTTVISSYGDGIQVDKATGQYVQTGGFVSITASSSNADRSHGVKSEGNVVLAGGALQVGVSDAGAKAVKADGTVSVSGGRHTLITSGNAVIDSGDTDYTSSSAIKADGVVAVSGGELWAMSTGNGGKGISSDATVSISGGTTRILTSGSRLGSSSGNMRPGQGSSSSSASSSPKGIKADGNITITGGTTLVRTTGGDGAEGIESKATITINGGVTAVRASDDAVNATTAIVMNDGFLYGCGTDNDGIDSNGTITVNGGIMIGSGTSSPEEGIDIDNGSITTTGGTIIGIGGSMNGTPPVTSGQTYVVASGLTLASGKYLNLATADGTSLLSLQMDRSMSQASVMISTPALSSGSSYVLSVGGTLSGASSELFGYATDGTFSGGSTTTLTAGTGGSSSQGGFGGPGGGRRF